MDHRVAGLSSERAGDDLAALSDREREVLELALKGLSARAIAERLTLTEATIRSHLSRIYAKLGVGGRVELFAHLNWQPPAEGDRSSSPSVGTEPPPRRRAWPVAALVVLLVTLSAGALFMWLRPDLPPATNLATVSQLVAQGQATNLDLRGDTLFVTTADGRHYRVDGVDQAAFREILAIKTTAGEEVSFSSSDDTPALVSVIAFVSATLPLVLLLVVALVAFRWLRRPPQPRPAG
jgi:DNA-binding CsgD family transcriptional regulator